MDNSMHRNKVKGCLVFLITVIAFLLLFLGPMGLRSSRAAEVLPKLELDDIARVDFHRSDTWYLPLLPGIEEDREKIARLVELYNQAAVNLGPEFSLYEHDPDVMPFFVPDVSITLTGGESVRILLYNGVSIYMDSPLPYSLRSVVDQELGDKLRKLFWAFFVPAQGVTVDSREPRMGGQMTVRSDYARGDEAVILLMPIYGPVTIPSAPYPYPIPEAILLVNIPVENDRFAYTFTLTEEIGKALDGSPGRIGPGAWGLVVNSGSVQTTLPVMILPPEEAPPRAVLYHQGQLFTWSDAEGIQIETLIDPAHQPLLLSEQEWGTPRTHLSLNFLHYLDIPLTMLEANRFQVGESKPGLTLQGGEECARVNGTMLSLGGNFQKWGDVWRITWKHLGFFFDYREQWLGPETVLFLRNLDIIPAELQREAALSNAPAPSGLPVTVTLEGKKIDLGVGKAYLDANRGRVMVPLRLLVEALRGNLGWYPVLSQYRETEAEQNYGLSPTGERVAALVEVTLGDKLWSIYLTQEQSGSTMVPLRMPALAFGYELSWDASRNQVNLKKASY